MGASLGPKPQRIRPDGEIAISFGLNHVREVHRVRQARRLFRSILSQPHELRAIEPEHILLGLIREDRKLLNCFLSEEAIADIEADACRLVFGAKELPVSVELPLSEAGQEVLRQAEEVTSESAAVYPVDLLIWLREAKSGTGQILLRRGLTLEEVRQKVADLRVGALGASPPTSVAELTPVTPSPETPIVAPPDPCPHCRIGQLIVIEVILPQRKVPP